MFRDRKLNISLLFSISWHLFWISIVYVVVTPTVKLQDTYTDINFLGPILEKTAFDMLVDNPILQTETLYQTSSFVSSKGYLDIKGPERIVNKEIFTEDKNIAIKEIEKKDKEPIDLKDSGIFYHLQDKPVNRQIEGPAKKRAVLYKPKKLYLDKSPFKEDHYLVKLKFSLSDSGNVESVEPVVSAGDPMVDMACIKHLKQWQFEPKSDTAQGKDWGIITINVERK